MWEAYDVLVQKLPSTSSILRPWCRYQWACQPRLKEQRERQGVPHGTSPHLRRTLLTALSAPLTHISFASLQTSSLPCPRPRPRPNSLHPPETTITTPRITGTATESTHLPFPSFDNPHFSPKLRSTSHIAGTSFCRTLYPTPFALRLRTCFLFPPET